MERLQDLDTAKRELGRFLALAGDAAIRGGNCALPMPDCFVDTAWHELEKDESLMASFYDEHAGVRLAHVPLKGHGIVPWVQEYEKRHGTLADDWFRRPDGSLDKNALRRYQDTGSYWASWECSPGLPQL